MSKTPPPQYYVQISSRAFGPFSAESIKKMIAEGRIDKTTLLSVDKQNWEQARCVSNFFQTEVDAGANDVFLPNGNNAFAESFQNFPQDQNYTREWLASVDGQKSLGPFTTRELWDLL